MKHTTMSREEFARLVYPHKPTSVEVGEWVDRSTELLILLGEWTGRCINQQCTQMAEVYFIDGKHIIRHAYDNGVFYPDSEEEVTEAIAMLRRRWTWLGIL